MIKLITDMDGNLLDERGEVGSSSYVWKGFWTTWIKKDSPCHCGTGNEIHRMRQL